MIGHRYWLILVDREKEIIRNDNLFHSPTEFPDRRTLFAYALREAVRVGLDISYLLPAFFQAAADREEPGRSKIHGGGGIRF